LGVIGGSGLYHVPEIEILEELELSTPYGKPSAAIRKGRMNGLDVFFLPRHGEGHVLGPSEIPYRANIYALKSLGVNRLLSISAVGSLKEEIEPGHLVVPDQIIDRTTGIRPATFFGDGLVVHVAMADPYCACLRRAVAAAARRTGAAVHEAGTLVCMEGPQFSTRAESFMYRGWNASLIGMTAQPEAKLAREAQMCYATLALATDYDCWREGHESVTVEAVIAVMSKNTAKARETIVNLPAELGPCACGCSSALRFAGVTHESKITPELRARFGALLEPGA
jgi:5'-methylthioadenosine phosphorylase